MPGIILKGDGFAGIQDAKRRAIYEAEKQAAALGVLPDDPEKRKIIVDRLQARLAHANRGWDFDNPGTVVRVDDRGAARVIPQGQGAGWLPGTHGGAGPHSEKISLPGAPALPKANPREAAERFHATIRQAMERTGYIPAELQRELAAEGWRLGQPVPLSRIEEWCSQFQQKWAAKYRR